MLLGDVLEATVGVELSIELGLGEGAGVSGAVGWNKSDSVQRSLRKLFRFGRTVVMSLSVLTPNHWATPFQNDSQGLVGIKIPGPITSSPSLVTIRS